MKSKTCVEEVANLGQLHPVYSCPGGEWSSAAVVSAIRNLRDLPTLSHTSYFAEIWQANLECKVPCPGEVPLDADSIDEPFWFHLGKNRYYLPGSLRDLITYTSSMVACHAAIHRAWIDSGTNEDCAPPDVNESSQGSLGNKPWRIYWRRLHHRMNTWDRGGHDNWILQLDIVHCAANIDVDRVTRLLEQIGAPATAVVTLDHMHRRWIRAGVNGIPIGSTFNLLLRLYFLAIEGDLRLHGLEFARIVDDFRIRCCSPADGLEKQAIVADLLSAYGFRLNAKKTMIFRRGGPKSFLTHTRLKVASKLKRGLLRPFLATNSMRPIVGSWAIRLLGAMNQMRRICPL